MEQWPPKSLKWFSESGTPSLYRMCDLSLCFTISLREWRSAGRISRLGFGGGTSRTGTGCLGQARMEETGEAIAELHTGMGTDRSPQLSVLLYHAMAVAMHRVLYLLTRKVTL